MAKKKGHRTKHFRDDRFLKALGQHCLRLRSQRGLSIDRLAKESEMLSPSAIHRLETGQGAVTVSTLLRYAQALELSLLEIVDFESTSGKPSGKLAVRVSKLIALDDRRAKVGAFKTLLPVYSLKAACGHFGAGQSVEAEGWIEISGKGRKLDSRMFVVQAVGDSMDPLIQNGDWLVMRSDPSGTRQGKIVLAQYRGPADPETGGSYTVKRYSSSKVGEKDGEWRHRQITLSPENPDFEPIVLQPRGEDDFRVVGEYLFKA